MLILKMEIRLIILISALFAGTSTGQIDPVQTNQVEHRLGFDQVKPFKVMDFQTKQQTIQSNGDSNTTWIGYWPSRPSYAVDVVGNIACFDHGGGDFRFLYIATYGLIWLGQIEIPTIRDVVLSGDYAYIAGGEDGLRIINFYPVPAPNPPPAIEVGSFNTGGYAYGIAVSGNYAYVADGQDGLRIIDISTPSSPQEISFINTSGSANDVTISGYYAYVADGDNGLRIIDVSTPSSPQEVAYFITGDCAYGVAISGNYAYVADGEDGLRIINISTSTPNEVGFFNTEGRAFKVSISGDYAYVASEVGGLYIIDVSTPSTPQGISVVDGYALGVLVNGDDAFVTWGDGMRMIDVTVPSTPEELRHFISGGSSLGLTTNGSYAYVANGSDGLSIIDISTPSLPVEISQYDMGYAENVTVFDTYAYISTGYGIHILDISNPFSPQNIGFYETPGYARDVAIRSNYAFVADGSVGGLQILDISTPSNPQEVGFFDTPGQAYNVVIRDNFAYVADGDEGLRILDISTLSNPQEIGYYNTPGRSSEVVLRGNYAYLADGYLGGIRIIDVSTPASPQEVGYFNTWGELYGVAVSGNYAYLADGGDGLRIMDISDPFLPDEVGFFDPGNCYARSVSTSNDYAFVTDPLGGGMYIVHNNLLVSVYEELNSVPESFLLAQNYPNPFNPATQITYSVPEESFVNVKVYDMLGREVANIVNDTKSAGNHNVVFDAKDLASGVYIYRITATKTGRVIFTSSKKMVLVR
jgi:hypothetical protein